MVNYVSSSSGVYEEVKQKSEQLWVINNFHLVHEFRQKPGPPIPFSILQNVMHIVNRIREKSEYYQFVETTFSF